MDALTQWRSVPGFAGLSEADLDTVVAAVEVRDFPDGHVFMEEGERPEEIFLVVEGDVGVTRRGGDGAETRLGGGALLGLTGVVGGESLRATFTATGPVRAGRLTAETYRALTADRDSLAVAFHLALGAQLAEEFRRIAARAGELLSTLGPGSDDEAVKEYDVVVIGAGPMGAAYAVWVKRWRPETRVALVDRKDAPGYKIGESTLTSSVRCFRSMGLELPVLRRLFANKSGLSWWWADESSAVPHTEVDGVDIAETFQVERRVLETAMHSCARREGVDVYLDTRVRASDSVLTGYVKELVCDGPEYTEVRFRCAIVCDASGPAAVVPRALRLYTKDIDSLNYNAYFGYFKKVATPELDQWDTSATRHLCFPDGWMWFITLESWQQASDENLSKMIDYLIDHPGGADEAAYPTRRELNELFQCPSEQIVSIGVTVRDDHDTSKHLPVLERFQYWMDRYPALKWVMDHYELVEAAYPRHRSYSAFMRMAHGSEQAAGDGWLAIGDAAAFVNPLISPGMTFGVGTSFMAARATVDALNRGVVSRDAFAAYEQYSRELFSAVKDEVEMLYRGFWHVDAYERTMMAKVATVLATFFGKGRARLEEVKGYSASDAYTLGTLDRDYVDLMRRVIAVQRAGEESGADPADVALMVRGLIDPYIASLLTDEVVTNGEFGRFCTNYTDELVRMEGRSKPPGNYATWRCPTCQTFVNEPFGRCMVCGEERPS